MLTVRLLGSIELLDDGETVDSGPLRQRSVLAALAIDAGRPVPTPTLIDRVWGDTPPQRAAHTLHVYIARLRAALVPLSRRSAGYVLDLGAHDVDALRFSQLVSSGARISPPAERARRLGDGLSWWRGRALEHMPGEWAARVRAGLDRQRLDALVLWARAGLTVPGADLRPVVRDLTAAVDENPLAEPLVAELMRALVADGRPADALCRYAAARSRISAELGVEPSAELRALHLAVVRGELGPPAATVAPAQLPRDVEVFVGRDRELVELRRGAAATVTVLTGTAGVGKTALAVHWAQRARHQFPDGQLYVNLRGFDGGGRIMTPGQALRGFLDTLGVAAERIPPDLDAQAGLYRSVVADRRMLVVLDNARDAEQVRPLLPGGAGIRTVVTSRDQLAGLLAVDGVRRLALETMSAGEARQLLAGRLAAGALDADPAAVAQVIAACARLPLALAIAAARVQTTGFAVATVAAELADTGRRLDVLDTGDRTSQIRTVFSWSYAALTPDAARLFLLLGLHPGPQTSAAAAAALAARPVSATRPLLAELTRANLLTEPYPGRFAFHDLLRAYASDQARTRLGAGDRAAAVRRVLAYYLHSAHAADRAIGPHRDPVPLPAPPPEVVVEQPRDAAAASAWFETEHAVLLAAVRSAADHDQHTTCWQLAWALAVHLDRRGHWPDWVAVAQLALDTAVTHGDRLGQAHAAAGLGRAYGWLGRHDDARAELEHALAGFAGLGDRTGQATVHCHLAWLYDRWGRYQEAFDRITEALRLYRAVALRPGIADAVARLGYHEAKVGRPAAALRTASQGLALHRQLGNRRGEALTLAMLGNIHQYLDQDDQAVTYYRQSAGLLRLVGERYYEGRCLAALGDTCYATGRTAEARLAWQRARDILSDLRHPEGDLVRVKLQDLPRDHSAESNP